MQYLWFVLLFIIPMGISFAQDTPLLNKYKIPSFSSHRLFIEAPQLLNIYSRFYQDDGSYSKELNLEFKINDQFFHQDSQWIFSASSELEYRGNHSETKYSGDYSRVNKKSSGFYGLTSYIKHQYYFTDRKGFFIPASICINARHENNIEPNEHDQTDYFYSSVFTGIGYGRIINVKTVSQARIITKELHIDASDKLIYTIANIIDKNDNGYYESNFKDSSKIQFYKDIAAVTGSPYHVQKIKRIIESKLYNIAVQKSGWQVAVFVGNNYYTTLQKDFKYEMSSGTRESTFGSNVKIDISYPLSYDLQYDCSLHLSEDLEFMTSFSFNHSLHWSSKLKGVYNIVKKIAPYKFAGMGLSLETDFFISNQIVISCMGGYWKQDVLEKRTVDYKQFVQTNETFSADVAIRVYVN